MGSFSNLEDYEKVVQAVKKKIHVDNANRTKQVKIEIRVVRHTSSRIAQ